MGGHDQNRLDAYGNEFSEENLRIKHDEQCGKVEEECLIDKTVRLYIFEEFQLICMCIGLEVESAQVGCEQKKAQK